MSQSATLYRISEDSFEQLKKLDDKQQFPVTTLAKGYSIFHGTFLGLEFILSKGKDTQTAELISEIFTPQQSLGDENLENMTLDEQIEFYENGGPIYYLDKKIISAINMLLINITDSYIDEMYDSTELNDNGIYPNIWHDDNSSDLAYNKRHLQEDITALKQIFKQADEDNNYMLVYVG